MWNLTGNLAVVDACAEWLMIVSVRSGGARTAFSIGAGLALFHPESSNTKDPE